ncbi:hypothetical protein FOQG_12798 [Fusarium oxysporum f. sp. raphani 54005]|uniref:Uncharacterized protein n=4 Tax=Fusarium oxysporum species complex TaxID=171631 RepID=X0BV91_FUSOX|nr:uncharacterized protein FOIG_15617 [Fusarium odoratissimum NRRL 54006]XP_031053304.1 uncharacterized protein FOIG_15617 [Fusarium odoratissimum NRRL 54006]EXA48844.1 hypothetical protein FOVG_02185 [Fusarium oxysporum f. sp. pisi HDV247]EXK82828.1 hypothetical protein FOQG_12798 [Fusarium oxysporum f. sp. raphani 54005]EXL60890.1 hypothetical protein FOCG_00162 [Fusarium oxysporum f. sp. radicis-lycopersici 26381]RKL16318.1 hypothetical protein BFJ70_g15069 [Fusarium oxysporum]TXC09734.1 h
MPSLPKEIQPKIPALARAKALDPPSSSNNSCRVSRQPVKLTSPPENTREMPATME